MIGEEACLWGPNTFTWYNPSKQEGSRFLFKYFFSFLLPFLLRGEIGGRKCWEPRKAGAALIWRIFVNCICHSFCDAADARHAPCPLHVPSGVLSHERELRQVA